MNVCPPRLLTFLQGELALAPDAITLALRQVGPDLHLLPIVLWQYGLVDLEELAQLWDWSAQADPTPTLTLVKTSMDTSAGSAVSPAVSPWVSAA
ncbi:DUF2949 domain-containing protein [Trichothermofontia sp.]